MYKRREGGHKGIEGEGILRCRVEMGEGRGRVKGSVEVEGRGRVKGRVEGKGRGGNEGRSEENVGGVEINILQTFSPGKSYTKGGVFF